MRGDVKRRTKRSCSYGCRAPTNGRDLVRGSREVGTRGPGSQVRYESCVCLSCHTRTATPGRSLGAVPRWAGRDGRVPGGRADGWIVRLVGRDVCTRHECPRSTVGPRTPRCGDWSLFLYPRLCPDPRVGPTSRVEGRSVGLEGRRGGERRESWRTGPESPSRTTYTVRDFSRVKLVQIYVDTSLGINP